MSKLKVLAERIHISKKLIQFSALTAALPTVRAFERPTTPDNDNPSDKNFKYWSGKTLEDILSEADNLFNNNKYLQVYELLNRFKYNRYADVQWRIVRALYKLSFNETEDDTQKEMIEEAYEIISTCLTNNEDDSPDLHKWAAIILDKKAALEGIESRLKNSAAIKLHLLKSCELNPDDSISQYLLGRWCYEVSNLGWFQRLLAKLAYGVDVPKATLEEAENYLMKAEELQPRQSLQNAYYLGKIYLQLEQFYKAKYYLELVLSLSAANDKEKAIVIEAKNLIKDLEKYKLGKNVLYNDDFML